MTTPEIEPRPNPERSEGWAGSHRTPDTIEAELADVARLIDRADAEALRLRRHRLELWRAARAAGLSWRAIARASGVDHAMVAKQAGVQRRPMTDASGRGRIDV